MRSLQDTSIQYIKGVGPARMKMFMRLGIENVEDLLYFFPKRYEDRRHLTPIAQVKLEEWQTISGKIISVSARKSWYTKKHVSEIVLDDGSGRMICTWFSQPYLQNYLKKEKNVVCYGKVDNYKERLQMVSPEYEIIEEEGKENLSINRIAPVYALTRGVTQRYLRKIIKLCIDKYRDQLQDTLPVPLRNKYTLPNIKRSISHIHFPKDFEDQENALKRISFEEFYFFQISIILRRLSITQKQGILHQITDSNALSFMSLFAFELTAAQKKVIRQIRQDMQNDSPMLRLLQGLFHGL
jgi:ATP-dependent DNA helicase RecG